MSLLTFTTIMVAYVLIFVLAMTWMANMRPKPGPTVNHELLDAMLMRLSALEESQHQVAEQAADTQKLISQANLSLGFTRRPTKA